MNQSPTLPPVDFGELEKAAERGAKKRGESPDAAMGRVMRLNRADRRRLAKASANCHRCGIKIKATNAKRHEAKCAS